MCRQQYDICPYCGAHLDHGEKCDCQDEEKNTGAEETPEDSQESLKSLDK